MADPNVDLNVDVNPARETLARLFRETSREFRAIADSCEAAAVRIEADMKTVESVPEWDDVQMEEAER